MTINATFTIRDTSGYLGAQRASVLANFQAAMSEWSKALAGTASAQVEIIVYKQDNDYIGFSWPTNEIYVARKDKYQVESPVTYQLRTGKDVNGSRADIEIYFNASRLSDYYIDPNPFDADTSTSPHLLDFYTAALAMVGHGLGVVSYRELTNDYSSPYDDRIVYINGKPHFSGENVLKYYGSPIPLSDSSLSNLGLSGGTHNSLFSSVLSAGLRYPVTSLEKAILADLGVGTNQSDILRVHQDQVPSSITLHAGAGTDTVVLNGTRASYTVTYNAAAGGYTVSGNGFTDTFLSVEQLRFTDRSLWIEDAAGMTKGVHRFYNTETNTHFFTGSNEETYALRQNNLRMEDEGFAFATGSGSSALDVYRFQNKATGAYFYTISTAERDNIQKTLPQFEYQGSNFRAYTRDSGPQEELYRFFNTATGSHFFTTSEAERDSIMATLPQYKYEGIGFYVDILS